ncbi:MAG: hypothetical protein ACYDHP_14190 [Ferrimicrobium sp.]
MNVVIEIESLARLFVQCDSDGDEGLTSLYGFHAVVVFPLSVTQEMVSAAPISVNRVRSV